MIDPRRGCLKKAVVDFHINEETIIETEKPVDYSFKKLTSIEREFDLRSFI